MTSSEGDGCRESFDNNAVEANGIFIEVTNPSPRFYPTLVFPIPKNLLGSHTSIQVTLRIINNTSTSFRVNPSQTFIPEVWTSDNQTRQRLRDIDCLAASTHPNRPFDREATSGLAGLRPNLAPAIEHNETRNFDWWEIKPELPRIIFLTALLYWDNNLLVLKVPTIPDNSRSSIDHNNCWYFEVIPEETYQLRFVLNTDCNTTPVSESDTKAARTAQETGSGLLASPFVNLRLVMPLSTDSSAIEVDGIQFKTEMPESVLIIPPNLPGARTAVKLGIRATNNTSTAFRFQQLDSLDLTLIGDDGKEIKWRSDLMRTWVGKGPNYYLAPPRDSALFVLDGRLSWHWNQLLLAIPNQAGGFYYFYDLKPGTYHLGLRYHIGAPRATNIKEQVLEKVWTGWIAMPFVDLHLVNL
ncbi:MULTISPECIES: hypothetical protein [unclassified Microcoleus]|uniref:hypothetical protein n=1 Tax=unclassified Microcoleus TaxID=2642155 RepID=UPI002FCFA4E2